MATTASQRVTYVIATSDLADRIGLADTRLWTEWFEAVRAATGDLYGVTTRHVGDAVFLRCALPESYYNRVMGLNGADHDRVDEALDFFAPAGVPFRVDMNPFGANEALTSRLIERRLYPASFQTSLYAEVDALEPRPPSCSGVSVRAVRKGELAFFARLYNRSYFGGERPSRRLTRFREASLAARYGRPGWRHYLALVDGIPAGGALMYVDGDVATLAGAATMFTMRRRGVQRALLARRLRDAAAAGCTLVASRCGVGSPSQRNMERAGLRTAYTKVVWTHRPG